MQDALCVVVAALRYVAGGLAVQQQAGGAVLVGQLLEDVVGVLQLVAALKPRVRCQRGEGTATPSQRSAGSYTLSAGCRHSYTQSAKCRHSYTQSAG